MPPAGGAGGTLPTTGNIKNTAGNKGNNGGASAGAGANGIYDDLYFNSTQRVFSAGGNGGAKPSGFGLAGNSGAVQIYYFNMPTGFRSYVPGSNNVTAANSSINGGASFALTQFLSASRITSTTVTTAQSSPTAPYNIGYSGLLGSITGSTTAALSLSSAIVPTITGIYDVYSAGPTFSSSRLVVSGGDFTNATTFNFAVYTENTNTYATRSSASSATYSAGSNTTTFQWNSSGSITGFGSGTYTVFLEAIA